MKKIIFCISSVIVLMSIIVFQLCFKNSSTNTDLNQKNERKDSEIFNIVSEDKEEEKNESSTKIDTNNNKDIKDDNSSIYSSNKNNMEGNNSSNSNVINNKTVQVSEDKTESIDTTIHEVKENNLEPKEEVKEIEKEEVRDDVVDTNSWFYSIHHGQIDTSTNDKCMSAGDEIAFIDTVDINYFRCYEVTSTAGKVLGYYLNIFCNSDNCNRYKNQINMSKYR